MCVAVNSTHGGCISEWFTHVGCIAVQSTHGGVLWYSLHTVGLLWYRLQLTHGVTVGVFWYSLLRVGVLWYSLLTVGVLQARIQGEPLGAEAPIKKCHPGRALEKCRPAAEGGIFSTCSRSALYGNEHFF